MQSIDAVRPVEGTRKCELEDKAKDLEQKVANLLSNNDALTTKLKAWERQQQEEITSLKEHLVQALGAQVIVYTLQPLLLNILMVYGTACACRSVYATGNCYSRAVTVKGQRIAA